MVVNTVSNVMVSVENRKEASVSKAGAFLRHDQAVSIKANNIIHPDTLNIRAFITCLTKKCKDILKGACFGRKFTGLQVLQTGMISLLLHKFNRRCSLARLQHYKIHPGLQMRYRY